jgi:hypothetical protein
MTAGVTILTASIAALAGLAGGLLTAFATRGVERMRLQAGLREKAEERKLEAVQRFLVTASSWLDWLIYMEEQGWQGKLDVQDIRSKERAEAYRQLLLVSSDRLYNWLVSVYQPAEYQLKAKYARRLRFGQNIRPEDKHVRQEYSRILRDEMINHFRPEVAALRDPVAEVRDAAWKGGIRR